MIVGLVRLTSDNLSPRYHLDRCAHCGGQKLKDHDKHGRCHRRTVVYVRNGRHWRSANDLEDRVEG